MHQHKAGTLKQSNKKHKNGQQGSNRDKRRGFGAGKVEKTSITRNVKNNICSNMAL